MQLNTVLDWGMIFAVIAGILLSGYILWGEILDKYLDWKFQRALRNTGISLAELDSHLNRLRK